MNSFVFIGRTFFYQTVGIIREVKSQMPDSDCTMLVAARSDTLDLLNSYDDCSYARYDWLSEYEAQWLDTPVDKKKLAHYEKKFGTQKLRAIVTSDRELGIGFVSGGVYAESKLLKLTRDSDDLRWRYVIGLLDYLYETFKRDKPEFVFAYCIAAATPYAMYLVAKDLGITFIQPVSPKIDNTYIIDDTMYQSLTLVQETFAKAKKDSKVVKDSIKKADEYIDKIRNRPQIPEYINQMKKESLSQAKISGMVRTLAIDCARWGAIMLGLKGTSGVIRQRKGWAILLENWNVFLESRKALRGKTFANVNLDEVGPYIYFPLHVDPEASTMVLADQLTDQMFIIETVAKNMPAGMKVLVKEHIPSIGRRPKGYYERIRNMPDVTLVSPFMDSFELIKKCETVFTVTGTAAWEAMILGKPAIMMGYIHYTNLKKGLIHCTDIANIGEAIIQSSSLEKTDEEELRLYIASLFEEGVYFPEALWYDSELEGDDEVSKKVVNKIKRLIAINKEQNNTKTRKAA